MDALDQRTLALTKSSPERWRAWCQALGAIVGLDGDIVETGIWQGGNLIAAHKLAPDRTIWGYDTFTGMPPAGPFDVTRKGRAPHMNGKSAVSMSDVTANLIAHGCDLARFVLVPGMIEATLKRECNVPASIALLRLDTDWYSSTKVALEILYPRLISGGIMIVDDYGHWLGARKAVNDYFRKAAPQWWPIDYTAVMAVKPAHAT